MHKVITPSMGSGKTSLVRLASVAGAVIQAIGRLEFEDGLRTGVLQEDCWCPCAVRTKPMVTAKHPFGVGHDPGGGGDDLGL